MKITKSQLKQIIKEELEDVIQKTGGRVPLDSIEDPYQPNPEFNKLGRRTKKILLQIRKMVLNKDPNLLKDEGELDKFLSAANRGDFGVEAEDLLYDLFDANELGVEDVSDYIMDEQ